MAIINTENISDIGLQEFFRPASVIIRKPLVREMTKRRILDAVINGGVLTKTYAGYSINPWNDSSKLQTIQTDYKFELDTAFAQRAAYYKTFLKKGVMKSVISMDNKINPATYFEDTYGFYVTASSDSVLDFNNSSSFTGNIPKQDDLDVSNRNDDIASITISASSKGISTATIVIKNANDKYTFSKEDELESYSSGFLNRAGETIFEVNDEISIYLPDKKGKVNLCFTGLVNKITKSNENGFRFITLNCECSLKFLRMQRTNLQPSLDASENGNVDPSVFSIPMDLYRKPVDLAFLLVAEALSNIYTEISFDSTVTEDRLVSYYYNKNRTPAAAKSDLILLLNDYSDTCLYQNTKSTSSVISLTKPAKIMLGVQSVRIGDIITDIGKELNQNGGTLVYRLYKQRNFYGTAGTPHKLCGVFYGTRQFAFNISMKEFNMFLSNWSTSFDILRGIADTFNFTFYTDAAIGGVRIGPPNLALQYVDGADAERTAILKNSSTSSQAGISSGLKKTSTETTLSTPWTLSSKPILLESLPKEYGALTNTTSPYELTKEDIYRISCNRDDTYIINWLPVVADFTDLPFQQDLDFGDVAKFFRCTVSLQNSVERYGWRLGKETVISTIKDPAVLYAYGLNSLDKQNAQLYNASAEVVGNSAIRINNNVYVHEDNTVYFLEACTYTFRPGETFTMSLTLNMGRKPIFSILNSSNTTASKLSSIVTESGDLLFARLEEFLDKVETTRDISLINKLKLINLLKAYKSASSSDKVGYTDILKTRILGDYVWDELPGFMYEESVNDALALGMIESFKKFQEAKTQMINSIKGTTSAPSSVAEKLEKLQEQDVVLQGVIPSAMLFTLNSLNNTSMKETAQQAFAQTKALLNTYGMSSQKILQLFNSLYPTVASFSDSERKIGNYSVSPEALCALILYTTTYQTNPAYLSTNNYFNIVRSSGLQTGVEANRFYATFGGVVLQRYFQYADSLSAYLSNSGVTALSSFTPSGDTTAERQKSIDKHFLQNQSSTFKENTIKVVNAIVGDKSYSKSAAQMQKYDSTISKKIFNTQLLLSIYNTISPNIDVRLNG